MYSIIDKNSLVLTIYTGEDCVFCERAIEFCKDQNIKYADMPITEYVKAIIKFEHGFSAKTVPQIFNEEEYIGGYTDLLVWAGKL